MLDLWTEALPVYRETGVAAKMRVLGETPRGEEGDAWADVEAVFARFDAADEYLFTVPMWNHGVPWVLKHLIDAISEPGMVFGFDPQAGYTGLLRDKRAVVVHTSGVYREGAPVAFGRDFHRAYFDDWLRWAGIDDVSEIRSQPALVTADAASGRRAALAEARELAHRLARAPVAVR